MQFEDACPKSGVSTPIHIGVQTQLFGRLRNLRANLTAYIFGKKHGIRKWASALQTTRGLVQGVTKAGLILEVCNSRIC